MGGYAEFLLLDDLCLTSGATRYRVSYPALITVRWCRTTGSFHPALDPSYLNEKTFTIQESFVPPKRR